VETLAVLVWLAIGAVVMLAVPVAALVALARANKALRELEELRGRVRHLADRQADVPAGAGPAVQAAVQAAEPVAHPAAHPPRHPAPSVAAAAVSSMTTASPPRPTPVAATTASPATLVPDSATVASRVPAATTPNSPTLATAAAAQAGVPLQPASVPPEHGDAAFVASHGPKILVGAGGLAVIVFLGLFVRYAWENDWVGPLGRVLSGAAVSLALVAGGLRIMHRRYRPLGQGLTAAGFAGLYLTAWAAHAVYQLVARATASGLLLAVIAAAAAVAAGKDARLLAGLAWLGGYLAPVLLSTAEDRAETLVVYLLLLGAAALWLDRRRRWPELPLMAALGTLLLFTAWYDSHFTPERLPVAAVGLLSLAALFALGPLRTESLAGLLAALATVAAGCGGIAMAGDADRPLGLLVLFVALAVLAELSAARSEWMRPTAAALAALGVLAWHDSFAASGRTGDALILGLGVAAAHVALLAAAGFRALPLRLSGALAHLAASLLAFVTLDRAFEPASTALFASTLALAAIQLLLGLEARRRGSDRLRARTALGLAAAFATLALPVRLGLAATTLAWAAEGVVLLWLGIRQRSALARGFGYAVLFLAFSRLFLRHVPLHPEPFTPVLNPAFGTWLCVIAALALGRRLARSTGDDALPWLDGASVLLLGPLTLALLFFLLSHETSVYFGHVSQAAASIGNPEAALRARREGSLAVSVLWTLFATGLLSAGLLLRSRPLFYASYALFALTAAKVVLVDIATLPTLYRMLSFLALGALLLAGAWLNLRFRERLTGAARQGMVRS